MSRKINLSLKSAAFASHLIDLRRAFHAEPELSYEEVLTAQKIMAELDTLEIPYQYEGKGCAVIGNINCDDSKATTIALRADMDGLPGDESTGLSFSSKHPGVMHACGHDAHMTILLGAARLLKQKPPPGNVLLVFQPAEEKNAGARVVINSGVLKNVKAIFAAHVTQEYHVGEIMIADGVITSQSDRFVIKIKGKGGHGARPHETIDAILISSLIINTLQTLVSREINPVHPSVVTVGRVESGTAANVIAETAFLEGSIRSTLPEVRNHLHRGLKRICNAYADLYDAEINIEIFSGYPPVVNSKTETEIARVAAKNIVGADGIAKMEHPSLGSEDFAFYLQKMPGCYVRLGARVHENCFVPLHSPCFDINEDVLPVGADYFTEVARQAIKYYG